MKSFLTFLGAAALAAAPLAAQSAPSQSAPPRSIPTQPDKMATVRELLALSERFAVAGDARTSSLLAQRAAELLEQVREPMTDASAALLDLALVGQGEPMLVEGVNLDLASLGGAGMPLHLEATDELASLQGLGYLTVPGQAVSPLPSPSQEAIIVIGEQDPSVSGYWTTATPHPAAQDDVMSALREIRGELAAMRAELAALRAQMSGGGQATTAAPGAWSHSVHAPAAGHYLVVPGTPATPSVPAPPIAPDVQHVKRYRFGRADSAPAMPGSGPTNAAPGAAAEMVFVSPDGAWTKVPGEAGAWVTAPEVAGAHRAEAERAMAGAFSAQWQARASGDELQALRAELEAARAMISLLQQRLQESNGSPARPSSGGGPF